MTTLGGRLARLRGERRQTLRAVAAGTGLAESFLSKLEHDKVNISISNLKKLADFFGVPLRDLFEPMELGPIGRVIRADQRLRRAGGGSGPRVELLSPTFSPRLEATLIAAAPGETMADPVSQAGALAASDRLVFVVTGRVRYCVGDEEYELASGDAIYHPHHVRSSWEALGEATLISVSTPPSEG